MSNAKAIVHALAPIPEALADVALVDVNTFAAVGSVSPSKVLEEVNAGRAPQPVVRRPRFTRWRLVDVRAYWARVAQDGAMGGPDTGSKEPLLLDRQQRHHAAAA